MASSTNVQTSDLATTDVNIDYLTNIQEQNDEMINDITELQNIEKELYKKLDAISSTAPKTDEQSAELKTTASKLVEQINNVSNMRISLYNNLQKNYTFYQNNVAGARETIIEQTTAINIVNNQLAESKLKLQNLQNEKNNKLRSIEINTYYGKQYDDYTNVMKIIIYTCVPIIILSILENKGIIPNNVYSWLFIIIMVIGVYFLGWKFLYIINKDNMNYDIYSWFFNVKNAPANNKKFGTTLSINVPNPFNSHCLDGLCCSDGSSFDSSVGKCVANS